jgi:hypothetical protein
MTTIRTAWNWNRMRTTSGSSKRPHTGGGSIALASDSERVGRAGGVRTIGDTQFYDYYKDKFGFESTENDGRLLQEATPVASGRWVSIQLDKKAKMLG